MKFKLDTTGEVPTDYNPLTRYRWSDLSPFTQGYTEAMVQSLDLQYFGDGESDDTPRFAAFADLAPETLARIIADCETAEKSVPSTYSGKQRGSQFWHIRADGIYPNFPPLTVTLGDDGKVRFA